MDKFDIPNPQELKPEVVHNYDIVQKDYNIQENNTVSTYNQFIQLRDTFVFTDKKYPGKASKKLCVGDKGDGSDTGTVEIWVDNIFKQSFQNGRASDPENKITTKVLPSPSGRYVIAPDDTVPPELLQQVGSLCCLITKDGKYKIVHKEEVLLQTGQEKVFCYVDVYRKNAQSIREIAYKGGIAVFDWQGSFSKTFHGTTDDGTCSVTVSFKIGDIIQKMTAFGYMERDLLKGDLLVLRLKDGPHNPSTGEPTGNDLKLQDDSNYRSIEYLDLPHNI